MANWHHGGRLTAGDIMSRDIITIHGEAGVAEAAALLHGRRLLSLPVVDTTSQAKGIISLLELHRDGVLAHHIASDPLIVEPERPLAALIRPLSEGPHHAKWWMESGSCAAWSRRRK